MLAGVHFSLISGGNIDKAFRNLNGVVKLHLDKYRTKASPVSVQPKSILIFASCFKVVRQPSLTGKFSRPALPGHGINTPAGTRRGQYTGAQIHFINIIELS